MKYRPILFSGPMVRALLDGTKTQTRRVVKTQPEFDTARAVLGCDTSKAVIAYDHAFGGICLKLGNVTGYVQPNIHCPYGQPGDRLWVRETFCLEHSVEADQPPPFNDGRPIKRRNEDDCNEFDPLWLQPHYRATDPTPELCYENAPTDDPMVRWKPSIHMPRWASRITLEITAVRVERLQDISEADAIAEGCAGKLSEESPAFDQSRQDYRDLWEQINGPGSWDANPWVWVVEFKRVER